MAGIMIVAGEASGDLHGGKLVAALKAQEPDLSLYGIGGDSMSKAGMELLYHVEELSFLGFTEVIKHLGEIRHVFHHLVQVARERKPDVVVLIDYPGFNLRLGRKLKSMGFKIFYFIAPQVWAWHQSRAKKMASFIERMVVLFDFEVDFFRKYGIDARFVGHPLVEGLKTQYTREQFLNEYGISEQREILALFPGSRPQELQKLLPAMLESAQQLRKKYPQLVIAVSQADTIRDDFLKEFFDTNEVTIVKNASYDLMKNARAAIVASGTATLETACFQTPFVIVYKISKVSFFIGRWLVKIPHIGLANIVAGKMVAREFLQNDVRPEMLVPELERCLYDESYRKDKKEEMARIRSRLGSSGASEKTAALILELIKNK